MMMMMIQFLGGCRLFIHMRVPPSLPPSYLEKVNALWMEILDIMGCE